MTTPERLRRRQYIESIMLGFLGLMVVISTLYNADQVEDQGTEFEACITSQVTALTDSLSARSELTEPETASVRTLIRDLVNAKTEEQGQQAIEEYTRTQSKIDKIRKQNPIPPFPDGKCD